MWHKLKGGGIEPKTLQSRSSRHIADVHLVRPGPAQSQDLHSAPWPVFFRLEVVSSVEVGGDGAHDGHVRSTRVQGSGMTRAPEGSS